MINPFESESPEELINIVSGAVIDEDAKQDIDRAYSVGNENFVQFVNTKVLCEKAIHFRQNDTSETKNF